MDHPAIDEEDVVERYLRRRLSAEDAQAFEHHYLSCPACLEKLEAGSEFAEAVRRTAARGLLDPPAPAAPAGKLLRFAGIAAPVSRWLALAALLVAALALSFLAGRQGLQTPAREIAGLQAQLLPVFLGAVRSAEGVPPVELRPAPEIESVLLIYELPAAAEGGGHLEGKGYRLILRRDGREIWSSAALAANDLGLTVAVSRNLLPPGLYELEAQDPGGAILGRAGFRVTS